MRAGIGYDVHKLIKGRRLVIGGVEIPYNKGLAGHSDADVLTHAISDSILGAASLGDIGLHFPDTDGEYKNISSIILLGKVCQLIKTKGFAVINIDCVVVAQVPKISPFVMQIRQTLATTMGIDVDNVSVKATTTEGLGFEGKGKGISAFAICMLNKKD
ncbi:MAG: 2-C-methyl-D-erythritol 2,4-cyclodiphosphate synthase [Clostridiaceae bacterium]|jgi:2-C-methyl-D-erythritol 2,4-cyclodiphosphate synthase|nr:2-C-methyl-D-erythritol 2,4-cyclodiphosphate synthase [Clostridiaceae bacterium]